MQNMSTISSADISCALVKLLFVRVAGYIEMFRMDTNIHNPSTKPVIELSQEIYHTGDPDI